MVNDEITKEILTELIIATQSGDKKRIEKAKYKALLDCTNLFELVSNYIFLDHIGIKFNFGQSVIKKGTLLYRIRKLQDGIDFTNPAQWTAPPQRPQNRANVKGQEALYLGSTESVCLLETHIAKDEKYVLATYECLEDISLGGYFTLSREYGEHFIAGIVLNAFLIAPSRSDKNKEIFDFLDNRYCELKLEELTDWKNNFDLPFKFAVLNRRDKYYELTNQICGILQKQNRNGIRYSSCYIPAEMPGICCSDFNIVLYPEGISKVKFVNCEIKTNTQKFTDLDLVKIVCETSDKMKKKK